MDTDTLLEISHTEMQIIILLVISYHFYTRVAIQINDLLSTHFISISLDKQDSREKEKE